MFCAAASNAPPWRTHPEHPCIKEPPMFAALLSALATTTDFTSNALIAIANVWSWNGG
ncbi:hypothetical protein GCM10009740_26460 [Terrabacter terrae]|uniref:Uncharacterized protein n=1 Tax=Terrabacter terrae TaxID=318434 RepID=A0ABN2UDK7_9MICO